MAKKIEFQLLHTYATDAKANDAERDRQYRLYTQFAYQIDNMLSGDSITTSPQTGKYNIVKAQINQVCNPVLEQPPEVTVYPGDGATKSAATALGGTIRHIQYECSAPQAYSQAIRTCTAGGLGAWIGVLDDDEVTEGLQPVIEDVTDPTTIHFDPTHRRASRKDARFVTREFTMAIEDFQEKYPGAQLPASGDLVNSSSVTADTVLLTEMYVRVLRDGRKAINRYVISDVELLETDETYSMHSFPIFLLEAPKCEIDGRLTLMPLTFDLIDVQRELAYWKTQTAKLIGRAPKSTYFADKSSIDVEDQQDYANSALDDEAKAILWYDSKGGTKAKPELIGAPEIPTSYLQLIQHNLAFARDITGIYPDQGQMQQQGQDPASGVAIKQQRNVAAISAAYFTNQLNYNLRLTGDWLVEVAQELLNDDSIRVSMQGDHSTQLVSYGPAQVDGVANYDLKAGKYGVVVGAAPNYATQKQELLQQLGEMANKNPKVFELVADYLVSQWPLPGTEDLQERLQVGLLPPQVQQLIASKANSDPAARAQQLQLQLQQVTMTKDQLQQMLTAVSEQLKQISDEYQRLKGDKQTEAQLKLTLESMKLDVERLRIESNERMAMHKTSATSEDIDAKNDVQLAVAEARNSTTLEVAAMGNETKVGTTAMQLNHAAAESDEARAHADKQAEQTKQDDDSDSKLPNPFA